MNHYQQTSPSHPVSRAAAVNREGSAGRSFPAVTALQDGGIAQIKPYQLQTGGVVQLGRNPGKKKTAKGDDKKIEIKKTKVESSDEETAPTTPLDVLMTVFDLEEEEAKELLQKSKQFNSLHDKNDDALAFLLSKQGRRKWAEAGLTAATLETAQADVARFDALKARFNLDDDLCYFAALTSDTTCRLDPDDIAQLDKINNDAGEEIKDPSFKKKEFIAGLEREQEMFHANLPSGGGGGSGDWALGSVRSEAKNLATGSSDKARFAGGKYTVHHKAARSGLKKLHKGMEEHPVPAQSFKAKLEEIGQNDLNGANNTEKILLNLPFNLEVGPYADIRIGDPGSGIDLNKTASGTVTPRSGILNEIDSATQQKDQMDQKTFWDTLAGKLERLRQLQQAQLTADGRTGSLLSAPKLDQWQPRAGGKFERL